jgi:hypothetical protein
VLTSLTSLSRRFYRVLAFLLGLLAASQSSGADLAPANEFQLKAVFLFNFVQFVQWPSSAFENADSPIVIGILGKDPFEGALDDAVAGELVRGRRILVRRFDRVEDARSAHVLFVSAAERANVDRVIATLRSRPILMVSDITGFARRGGTIAFYFDGSKLKFEINPAEAQRSGLQLSSQLLNLARIVPASG